MSAGRVLFVDDQPEVVAGFRELLEMEGIETFLHTSVITLPMVVGDINPDVIMLDLSLPALSSAALFRKDGRRVLRTQALLILFSGRDSQELEELTEELGADGSLAKQEDVDRSIRQVKTWILHNKAINLSKKGVRHATPSAFPSASDQRPQLASRHHTPKSRLPRLEARLRS